MHVQQILFMKRKTPAADEEERGQTFASMEETCLAILAVLRVREQFLRKKGRQSGHVLNHAERGELVEQERSLYESTQEQRNLHVRFCAS